jgi:ribokinase
VKPLRQFDVVVCGSLHLDIMLHAPNLPRPDETVAGSRWERKCGGKGGNQAIMATRAGASVAMIGKIGEDEFGQTLRANLLASGVDASEVRVDAGAGSGMSAAIVQSDGEYGAVIVSGANLRIDPGDAVGAWERLGGAPVLALQNEIPEPVNIAVAGAARTEGSRVVLNAAPARAMPGSLLEAVDVLVVNRIEAGMLSRRQVVDRESAIAALTHLANSRFSVVLTLGAGGVVVSTTGTTPQWIEPVPVHAVSTHGAGDSFVGALARRLALGTGLCEACDFANRFAAAFVAGSDPTVSVP